MSSGTAPPPATAGTDGVAERAFRWLPHVLLAVSLLLTVLAAGVDELPRDLPLVAVLAAAASGWTLLALGRGHAVRGTGARHAGYFAVRIALTAALAVLAPWFGVYAWFAYVEAIRYFRLPAVVLPIAATAAVTSLTYLGGPPRSVGGWGLYAVIVVGSTVLVTFFAVTERRTADRDADRERTVAALVLSNERREAALAENRGLQDQLVSQAREAGVLDERARLAGEIHDTLAQALAGILTQLEAAERQGELTRTDGHVDSARRLARSGLAEARRSLHALRPTPLLDSRLQDAIAETASRWSATSGVPVAVDVTGDAVALGTEAEVALLRAAQEGLANVARHAGACSVGLTLSYLGDVVLLDVRDDGAGFHPGSARPGADGRAVGLATMRERLRRVGGELEVESEVGAGTALVARVPVP